MTRVLGSGGSMGSMGSWGRYLSGGQLFVPGFIAVAISVGSTLTVGFGGFGGTTSS